MVFGFFGRSKAPSGAKDDVDHRSHSPSSNASIPPQSPFVTQVDDFPDVAGVDGNVDATNVDAPVSLTLEPPQLRALIKAVPPKILHEFTLAHLPNTSQEILQHLCIFFASLTPPPKLHCVRCHKNFVEVENTDRSCLIPHDDESAEVEHVGTSKSKVAGVIGTTYETLWGCCGGVVEGDGGQGPPDGWCYEGFHTTDVKRARFRADSTPNDDKLTSCERLRCFLTPEEREAARSRRMRARSRKNLREDSDSDDEALQMDVVAEDLSDLRSAGTSASKKSRKSGAGGTKRKRKSDTNAMQVDGEGDTAVGAGDADTKSVEGSAGAVSKTPGKGKAKAKDIMQENVQTPKHTPKPKSKAAGMKAKARLSVPVMHDASANVTISDGTSPPLIDGADPPAAEPDALNTPLSTKPAKPKPKRPRKSLQAQAESGRYVPRKGEEDEIGSSEEEGYGESKTKKRKRKSTVD